MMTEVMANEKVKVLAGPDVGGAPSYYDIQYDPGEVGESGFDQTVTIDFAIPDRDIPGVTEEALLSVVKDRMAALERSHKELDRKEALFYVSKAIECLRRTN